MNSRARRPGEGQLSLLELDLLRELDLPPKLDLLDDRDRAVLAFARDHHLQARLAHRVRSVLGVDQTRYYQLLAALLDRPAAAAAEPELIAGLRALRDRRQRLRRPAQPPRGP